MIQITFIIATISELLVIYTEDGILIFVRDDLIIGSSMEIENLKEIVLRDRDVCCLSAILLDTKMKVYRKNHLTILSHPMFVVVV